MIDRLAVLSDSATVSSMCMTLGVLHGFGL